jgi:hypothetical protein
MKKLVLNVKYFGIWGINSICALRLDTPVSLPTTIIVMGVWFVLLSYLLNVL